MKMLTPRRRIVTHTLLAALTVAATAPLGAQAAGGAAPADRPAVRNAPQDVVPAAKLVAEPASLNLKAGQTATIKIRAFDATGKEITNPFVQVRSSNRAVRFTDTQVTATAAGRFEATAMTMGANGAPLSITIPINVIVTSYSPSIVR